VTKTLLAIATTCLWASYAFASDAYSDPDEYRTPGVVVSTAGVHLKMADTDPFELRVPGVTFDAARMHLKMVDTDPFQLRVPGIPFGAPGAAAATQSAKHPG